MLFGYERDVSTSIQFCRIVAGFSRCYETTLCRKVCEFFEVNNYHPQTKLREGNVFTCICLFTGVCVCILTADVHQRQGTYSRNGWCAPEVGTRTRGGDPGPEAHPYFWNQMHTPEPEVATKVGSTHPTGMIFFSIRYGGC